MKNRQFIKVGDLIIPIASVKSVDMAEIEQGIVAITYGDDNKSAIAKDFDAFEAVMLLQPAALEGRRLRWAKNAWAFHNLVAHPLMQLLVWLGFKKRAIWLHDVTVPKPVSVRP